MFRILWLFIVFVAYCVMPRAGFAMVAPPGCTSTSEITKCGAFSHYSPTSSDIADPTYSNNNTEFNGWLDGTIWVTGYTTSTDLMDNITCHITEPFNYTYEYMFEPTFTLASFPAQICTGEVSSISSTVSASQLPGDTCPDGFFTIPYDRECGVGMVDAGGISYCADDTSGDFCLMPAVPATVPCDLGISNLKTSTGLSIPLFAEKYTSPAIHIGYNGGICYADLTIGQEINAININYNGTVYHTTVASSGGNSGDTGGGNTGGDDSGDTGGGNTGGDDSGDTGNDIYKFTATTTSDTSEFSFSIWAAGTFYVDWGDGTTETIEKTNTTTGQGYAHTYASPGTYNIKLGGLATGYRTDQACVDFSEFDQNLSAIDGCLGCIFPTLSDGTQPNFDSTFRRAQITSIPANLFSGITGAPASNMFAYTFYKTKITSIPAGLFAGLDGAPAGDMFERTFSDTQITSIPENLFAGINGAPASSMFSGTFSNTQITSIPSGLFSGITGAPASSMFSGTFSGTPITSIPSGLFAGINGAPAKNMFYNTFSDTQITGIPENLFAGINGAPASNMFYGTFERTPITSIPSGLFAGINGAPASYMFYHTFYETQITSIPAGLFAGLDGAPASYMFDSTFYRTQITGIPENLFAGIKGAPASSMFNNTFFNTKITSIPSGLFSGITGAPASSMFSGTFFKTKITSIPDNLFAGIKGAPASSMFDSTFDNTPITSIPENLFAGIDTTAPLQEGSFQGTFHDCTSLTGPSARINGKYLYEIWPDATSTQVGLMYCYAKRLTDYANIPDVWK